MTSIISQVGPAHLDHCTMYVQPGKMNAAVTFFTEFLGHWREVPNKLVSADWGTARFVESFSPIVGQQIQLSEPMLSEKLKSVDEVHHIALAVDNPELAAELSIVEFGDKVSLIGGTVDPLPGGKWWVTIPGVFVTPIEFVPKR